MGLQIVGQPAVMVAGIMADEAAFTTLPAQARTFPRVRPTIPVRQAFGVVLVSDAVLDPVESKGTQSLDSLPTLRS